MFTTKSTSLSSSKIPTIHFLNHLLDLLLKRKRARKVKLLKHFLALVFRLALIHRLIKMKGKGLMHIKKDSTKPSKVRDIAEASTRFSLERPARKLAIDTWLSFKTNGTPIEIEG